jgi:hypothetical protein
MRFRDETLTVEGGIVGLSTTKESLAMTTKLTPGGYALAVKDAAGDTEFRLTALIALAQDIAPGPVGEASVAYFNEKAESRIGGSVNPATESQPETPSQRVPE